MAVYVISSNVYLLFSSQKERKNQWMFVDHVRSDSGKSIVVAEIFLEKLNLDL